MTEPAFVEKVKAQIRVERATANKILELEGAVTNLGAKLFLAEMRFDTEKHANLLQTMLDLLDQCEPDQRHRSFWQIETGEYGDALVIKRMLTDHVSVEVDMLKQVETLLAATEDPALNVVFHHVLADERKHHANLETILEQAFKIVSLP